MKHKRNNEDFTLEEITELCKDGQDPKEIYRIIHNSRMNEYNNNKRQYKTRDKLKEVFNTVPRWKP